MYSVQCLNENSILISFADEFNEKLPLLIRAAQLHMQSVLGDALLDFIPAYTTLLIVIDINELALRQAMFTIEQSLQNFDQLVSTKNANTVRIPVYYSIDTGPDLARISQVKQITCDEVIYLHSQAVYQVYAVGFVPGFAYLGIVNSKIVTPRLPSPRKKVP